MKKTATIFKIIVLVFFIVFAGLQFIPRTYNQSDEIPTTDITSNFNVPEDVRQVLKTSCYDCHSNNTNYPWYHRIQPVAMFMQGHITDGKEELNFSEFGDYSKRRQESKLKSIISQIKSDEMPLPSYIYIHWDAKLSDEQKNMLEDWVKEVEKGF